ncbi:MAG: histidine phosphatase family protein [Parcubacteria group bacterium]|nr:histidine phosphatase family protein [Parcubacteria group bacterium]
MPFPICTFARHGQAGKAKINTMRRLTPNGREQGKRLGQLLGVNTGTEFDLVLHSDLTRTRMTAENIFHEASRRPRMVAVTELYAPKEGTDEYHQFMEMFNRLGTKLPLQQYLEQDTFGVMKRFALRGAFAVITAMLEHQSKRPLIVGHTVNQQGIAKAICEIIHVSVPGALMDGLLGDGEAFTLNPDWTMQRVEFIRQPAT